MARMTANGMNCRLIVFAKAPTPGEVKTRLLPFLGVEAVTALYEKLVMHSLRIAVESNLGPVELWCWPSTEHPFFPRCAEKFRIELHQQVGEDLGERMADALSETLTKDPIALLIGTDCPSLNKEDLREAKEILEQGIPAVITPAEDGGYVLIGLRQYEPTLFKGISWGTDTVLEETRERLRELRWNWRELTQRWDVDRPEDVERLKREGFGHIL